MFVLQQNGNHLVILANLKQFFSLEVKKKTGIFMALSEINKHSQCGINWQNQKRDVVILWLILFLLMLYQSYYVSYMSYVSLVCGGHCLICCNPFQAF